jgi:hypothetical protein
VEKYNLDDKGGLFKFIAKSPSKIVKQGDSIELKHFGTFNLIKATASDITETSFRIQSTDKIVDAKISTGDHVMLYYSTGDHYIISGEVGTVSKLDPIDLVIKVIKIEKFKDLIKEKKYCVSLNANFKIVGVPEPKQAAVKNISFGGIKADCNEDIMMEDIIEVTIYVDKLNKMPFKGRIVRKNKIDNKYEYGIEYSEVTESGNKLLTRLIHDIEGRI